jgi:hypothetical protein
MERATAERRGGPTAAEVKAISTVLDRMKARGQMCQRCEVRRADALTRTRGRWTAICGACSGGRRTRQVDPSVSASRARLARVMGQR